MYFYLFIFFFCCIYIELFCIRWRKIFFRFMKALWPVSWIRFINIVQIVKRVFVKKVYKLVIIVF